MYKPAMKDECNSLNTGDVMGREAEWLGGNRKGKIK